MRDAFLRDNWEGAQRDKALKEHFHLTNINASQGIGRQLIVWSLGSWCWLQWSQSYSTIQACLWCPSLYHWAHLLLQYRLLPKHPINNVTAFSDVKKKFLESDSDKVGLFKGVFFFFFNMDFPVANRSRLNYSTGCRHVNSSYTESLIWTLRPVNVCNMQSMGVFEVFPLTFRSPY